MSLLGGIVMDINLTGSALMHLYVMLKNPNEAHTCWHTLEKSYQSRTGVRC